MKIKSMYLAIILFAIAIGLFAILPMGLIRVIPLIIIISSFYVALILPYRYVKEIGLIEFNKDGIHVINNLDEKKSNTIFIKDILGIYTKLDGYKGKIHYSYKGNSELSGHYNVVNVRMKNDNRVFCIYLRNKLEWEKFKTLNYYSAFDIEKGNNK